jgi:alkylhydroperoxidase family enzyme
MDGAGFLSPAPESEGTRRLYDGDVAGDGYVMNLTRVWAHRPELIDRLTELLGGATEAAGLTLRQRGVLVTTVASVLGDSYCSLAWGQKLADAAGVEVAVAALTGVEEPLAPDERALAAWARQVVRDPSSTTVADVQLLRDAGFDDSQIVAITAYVAGRLAFSTVNDALGARPDAELGSSVDPAVRAAVTWGRPVADG